MSPPADGPVDAPRLPPPEGSPARLLAVPGSVVADFDPRDVVGDAVGAADPDLVVPVDPDASLVRPAVAGVVDPPVLAPGRGTRTRTVATDAGVVLAVPSRLDRLPATPADLPGEAGVEEDPGADGAPRVCLLTDAVSLRVDPNRQETTLRGAERYREAVPGTWFGPGVTHLSTALRPGFAGRLSVGDTGDGGTGSRDDGPDDADESDGSDDDESTRSIAVHGVGCSRARLGAGADDGAADLAVASVYPNGAVAVDALAPDRLGLRGLTGVGEARAEALRRAGYRDRAAVADAPVGALTDLPRVGRETATEIRASAQAVAEGEVVRTGDGALPTGDPVFVDVETDGLAASTVWLVGVLDGGAEDGHYLAFREPEPGSGDHLEAFCTWLAGTARNRPVVAYNGYGFDFDAVRDALGRHHPDLVERWDDRYLFDPLYWARTEGNAALPGRTDELDRVAAALGYDYRSEGLDGRTTARVYGDWRARHAGDPATADPPDWERLEAYCEDDVRALATVYEALSAADPPTGRPRDRETGSTAGGDSTTTGDADTSQGSLSDFT